MKPLSSTEAVTLAAELEAIKGEAIGWLPLGQGAYFHHGDPNNEDNVVVVVGAADARMEGMNVLLLA